MDKNEFKKELESIEKKFDALLTKDLDKAVSDLMTAFDNLKNKQKMFKDIYYKTSDLLTECNKLADDAEFSESIEAETLGDKVANLNWIGEEMEKQCQNLTSIAHTVEDVDVVLREIKK